MFHANGRGVENPQKGRDADKRRVYPKENPRSQALNSRNVEDFWAPGIPDYKEH